MTRSELQNALRPKGTYTKTDMENYTQLSAGKIKVALQGKTSASLLPLFSLIEDKDSSVGSEIEKRVATLENKFFTHALDPRYETSLREIIMASLDARLYGIGVVELYIDEGGGFAFAHVDKKHFHFDDNDTLQLKQKEKLFTATEPKYIIFRAKPVLIRTLWIVYAKHFVLSHFLKFTEFLGVPPLVANVSSSDDETLSAVSAQIARISSASYAVFGKDDILKVLEGRGSGEDFMKFVGYADAEIAKAINAQVLTSNVGSSGSLAQAKVHEKQRLELLGRDAAFASRCAQEAFALIGLDPKLQILFEEDTDLHKRAQTLAILHGMGYEMSQEDISREFDLNLTKKKEPNARHSLSKNAIFATKPIDKIDQFLSSKGFKTMLEHNAVHLKKEVEKIMLEATTFEEAFEALTGAYPNFPLEELEETFMTVFLNADLQGASDEE